MLIRVSLLSILLMPVYAVQAYECTQTLDWQAQKQHLINVNASGLGVVTLWGVTNWDYFSNSPKAQSEDWFANDTDSGGADKLGHLYTGYVTAHGLSYLYESWCFNQRDAAFYGALSSLIIMGYMEVGDSFSDFGFSTEDLIANGIGSLLGYALYINPDLGNKIDIRWEYGIEPNDNDFSTDYENSKYLFALKLNGFEYFRHSVLKHIELQLGYYTRGFDDPLETRERNVYLGVGLNLTDLFHRHGYKKTSKLFKYIQLPGTYIEFDRDINR